MPVLERPLTRICHRLWEDDYEALKEMAQESGTGLNLLIRQIIHTYVVQMQAARRRNLDRVQATSSLEIDLPEDLLQEEEPEDV